MATIREIDEQIRELEKEAEKILLSSIYGHYSSEDEQKQKIEEARKRTGEITDRIHELTEKKLELIRGARVFLEHVTKSDLDNTYMVDYPDLEEKMVKAVKLFLRIPMTHRRFVLDKSMIGFTASIFESNNKRHEKWKKLVYSPLLKLTRTSKIDLPEREKAKLLGRLLEQTGIDAFTFKRLLEEGKGDVLLLINTYVEHPSEEDKIRAWLKEVWDR